MDYKTPTPNRLRTLALSVLFLSSIYISYGQSKLQKQSITASYEMSQLQLIKTNLEKDFDASQKKLAKLTTSKGWKTSEKLPNGSYVELQDIGPDGTPIYYTTLGTVASSVTRANALHTGGDLNLGIHGEGMNVGIWDAGVARYTHQEFQGRVHNNDYESEIQSHATMVTGALLSGGVHKKAQGVAYKANATTNDWRRDKIEVAEAAANGLLLSNHSYGIQTDRVPDWYFGSYIKVSQDWDNIMYNAPYYLMVTAAGNARNSRDNDAPVYGKNTDGFDLMLGFSTAKNGIVVAAADTDINRNGNLVKASVANYSSFGPIDDGRVKPDLATGGSNVFTTNSNGDKGYASSTGTSIAAPGITGSLLLLQQYHEKLYGTYMKAATLKGLALHTADDVNAPGPDYTMGWGVMNTKKAADVLTHKEFNTSIEEVTLAEGEIYTITVNASESQLLKASISWTDPSGNFVNRGVLNDATPALTNDLDIRITQGNTTYFPWRLSAARASSAATQGDNTVDPFEKIDINNASGEYTISVRHKGTLQTGKQDFTIILTGIAVTGCSAKTPRSILISEPESSIVPLEWEPMEDAIFEVQYKKTEAADWNTLYTQEHHIALKELSLNANYEVRLRTICTENVGSDYSEIVTFTFKGAATIMDAFLEAKTAKKDTTLQFSVYPNPAVEQIKLQGNFSDVAQYSIISTSGETVRIGDANTSEINVSDLSSGLYILSVQSLEGVKSTKFYKS